MCKNNEIGKYWKQLHPEEKKIHLEVKVDMQ